MQQITLSDEQLELLAQASGPVAFNDAHGRCRGYFALVVGADELADARRALAAEGPRYTTAEVLAKFDLLRAS